MPDIKNYKLVALIPAYNEARHLSTVVTRALVYLPVLVVDDGSTDDTAGVAEVTRRVPNQDKGAALRTGFRYAIEQGNDSVLTLDADGQHDPAEIPKFKHTYCVDHPDLLIGARDFSHMPPIRRLANTLGKWTFSWAVGQPVRNKQSGSRLLSYWMM